MEILKGSAKSISAPSIILNSKQIRISTVELQSEPGYRTPCGQRSGFFGCSKPTHPDLAQVNMAAMAARPKYGADL
jgi:hypothetical protein